MQEIVAGRSWCFLSEQKSVCLGLCHTYPLATSAYWALLSDKSRCCPQPGAYKGRFSWGLVLDGSLGAGGTDEAFLYLRLTCKI
jgi:hypothetical protein